MTPDIHDPNDPAIRKPPETDISLEGIEPAIGIVRPKTDAEKLAEQGLQANIEKAAEEANPQNETLRAMEGK